MNQGVPSPSFSPRHIPPPPPINYQQARSSAPVSQSAAQQPPRYVHRDLSSPNLLSPLNQTASSPHGANGLRLGTGVHSPLSSPHGSVLSPQSAVSNHSPMAMRGASGSGPVVGYNPQQWGSHGPAGGAFIPHSALAPTAIPANPEDGLVDAPPPYSSEPTTHSQSTPTPPPSQQQGRPSLPYIQTSNHPLQHPSVSSYAAPASAISLVSPAANMLRNGMTPINPQPMSFPPPPGASNTRDRSVSRSGRSRFGLSALARGISSDRSTNHTPEPPNVQHQVHSQAPNPALAVPRPRPTPG
jgi:hypothetical protein